MNMFVNVGVEESPLICASTDIQVRILHSTLALLALIIHVIGLNISFLNITAFLSFQILQHKKDKLCNNFDLHTLFSVFKECNHEWLVMLNIFNGSHW